MPVARDGPRRPRKKRRHRAATDRQACCLHDKLIGVLFPWKQRRAAGSPTIQPFGANQPFADASLKLVNEAKPWRSILTRLTTSLAAALIAGLSLTLLAGAASANDDFDLSTIAGARYALSDERSGSSQQADTSRRPAPATGLSQNERKNSTIKKATRLLLDSLDASSDACSAYLSDIFRGGNWGIKGIQSACLDD